MRMGTFKVQLRTHVTLRLRASGLIVAVPRVLLPTSVSRASAFRLGKWQDGPCGLEMCLCRLCGLLPKSDAFNVSLRLYSLRRRLGFGDRVLHRSSSDV